MKKLSILLAIFLVMFNLTGCQREEKAEIKPMLDALKFKEEYESLNSDDKYRNITINETNPFVYTTGSDIVERIKNGETFYVYFGSNYCPWCRSVIEKAIEVANKNNIDKIYYVNIWGNDHEEILRDKYELDEKGKAKQTIKGQDGYDELLKLLDNVLSDYTLTDSKGKTVKVGEKRIMAPNFIYIENGKAIKLVSGISDKQKKSSDELTSEILKDEEKILTEFFAN